MKEDGVGKTMDIERSVIRQYAVFGNACHGNPPSNKALELWDRNKNQKFANAEISSVSTSKSADDDFKKILEQIISKKRKRS